MSIRSLTLGVLTVAVFAGPKALEAATPSPQPTMHAGLSGPYTGLKYTGDVGSGSSRGTAKSKLTCKTKGCKPNPKPTK